MGLGRLIRLGGARWGRAALRAGVVLVSVLVVGPAEGISGHAQASARAVSALRAKSTRAAEIVFGLDARTSGPTMKPVVTARPDAYSTADNAILRVSSAEGVLANDSDSAHHPLRVDRLNGTGGTPPLHGFSRDGAAVTIRAKGGFIYDPSRSPVLQALGRGQTATDSFTYRANDEHGGTGVGRVTITVSGVNRPPVLSGIESSAVSYDAGTPGVQITGSLTVSDPDDTNLQSATVRIGSGFVSGEDSLGFVNQNGITGGYNSATGVLTLSGSAALADYQQALRSVTFSDSSGTNPTTGTRTISFQVDDGHASNNLSNTVSRGITVNPNPPPTANNDSASTDSRTAINIPVLANDSDSDGDILSVASVDATGTKGSVSINPDGTIRYDPSGAFNSLAQGQTTTDTFTYKATDGYHDSGPATVTVTITGAQGGGGGGGGGGGPPGPPVLAGIESSAVSYDAGTPPVSITSSLTVSDPGASTLAGATVSIGSGFVSSEDSLGFVNQNGITGSYDGTTGVLTLTGSASLASYQTALRSVTFSDLNGTSPTTGARTISFQADNGQPSNNLSNVVSRDVMVNPNPAPTANDDTASTGKSTAIDISVLANDSDSDGDPLSVASVDKTGTKGSVSINPNGTIHYDPNGQFSSLQAGHAATDTFTYKASDGYHNSNSATVTVTINGSNDAPVLAGIESTTVSYDAATPPVQVTNSLTVSDDDDTSLQGATVSIGSGFMSSEDSLGFVNQNGITGSYDGTTGVLTLTGSASLANYQTALRSVTFSDLNGTSPTTGARTISFQVDDGHASNNLSNVVSRDVMVNPNPAPTANDDTASTGKNTAIDIPVLANDSDSDGDPLRWPRSITRGR